MDKEKCNIKKITFNFIIGFIVFQMVGYFAATFIWTLVTVVIKELIIDYDSKLVLYLLNNICSLLIMNIIATMLVTKTLFKSFSIDKNKIKNFLINISLFFIVVSFFQSIIKFYDTNIEIFIISLIINIIVCFIMVLIIKKQILTN